MIDKVLLCNPYRLMRELIAGSIPRFLSLTHSTLLWRYAVKWQWRRIRRRRKVTTHLHASPPWPCGFLLLQDRDYLSRFEVQVSSCQSSKRILRNISKGKLRQLMTLRCSNRDKYLVESLYHLLQKIKSVCIIIVALNVVEKSAFVSIVTQLWIIVLISIIIRYKKTCVNSILELV